MKRFRFRLQRVLDYRKIVKGEKQRTLLLKNHELRLLQEELVELENARLANEISGGLISAELVLAAGLYAARLKQRIIDQRLAIIRAQDEVEKALAEYMQAAKDEKALISLKDKKYSEYRESVLAEEGRFLDELSTQRGNSLLETD